MNPETAPKYRCLIVDDEPIAHRILQSYLEGHERVELLAHAYHGADARRWCQTDQVDVLLLDIQMPEETGLDFLRSLEKRPVTILTTAHLEFALEGYELGVMDYLVKPIRRERFDLALQRAVEFLDLLQLQSTLQTPVASASVITLKSGSKNLSLNIADITHVQGLKDYAIIHTESRRHVVRMTMKNLANLLAPFGFAQVHKSFIVAANKLPLAHRNQIEFNGVVIPIGRRFKAGKLYVQCDN